MKASIKQILIVGFFFLSTYTFQAQTSDGFFRTVNALYGQYRGYYDSQQYDLAIQPLKDLVQLLDTATADVSERLVNGYKSDAYYNLACCYSLTYQKKPALKALEQAVQSGYKDYGNMKSDTDLDFIRKERKFKKHRYAGSKYVRLLPLGFEKEDDEWVKNTHDEGYFWQAPSKF